MKTTKGENDGRRSKESKGNGGEEGPREDRHVLARTPKFAFLCLLLPQRCYPPTWCPNANLEFRGNVYKGNSIAVTSALTNNQMGRGTIINEIKNPSRKHDLCDPVSLILTPEHSTINFLVLI